MPVHAGERDTGNFGPLYNPARPIRVDHLAMKTAPRQIVAFGGGGFSMESGNPLLDDYVLGLTGAERPRVCFLPSASGDADHYIVRFYRAFSAHRCEASHVSLFRREQGPEDLRRAPALPGPDLRRRRQRRQPARRLAGARDRRDPARSLGGGRHSLRPLGRLAVLVRGGGDRLPRGAEAARGPGPAAVQQLRPLRAWRQAPRRPTTASCARGCAPGYAAEDGAALHFVDAELSRVVASRPEARGYRLDVAGQRVVEMRIATTFLGDRGVVPAAPVPEALSTAVAA